MTFNYELTKDQRSALRRIKALGNQMLNAWSEKDLKELFEEAENLWFKSFPFEASQMGDSWYLKKRYNDLLRIIRRNPKENVNVNLFGCNITINIK